MLDVEPLLSPERYPHPVESVRLMETHISWVLLTGRYAYKIRKPVDLGFLDFRTLEAREHDCHEELRLNRRLAPDLYLDVVPVTGREDAPDLRPDAGPTVDWAVRMREFAQEDRLDHRLEAERLGPSHIDALADRVAHFHQELADRAPPEGLGTPAAVLAAVRANFDTLGDLLEPSDQADKAAELAAWSEAAHARLAELLAERRAEGWVREGHGDMHLGNIALVDGEITVFDAVEFNPGFRWIDVQSEFAFLVTDLDHRGHPGLGWRALNRYLEWTGDYAGLRLLDYYRVYRMMVRAKVTAIRRSQREDEGEGHAADDAELARYLSQACAYVRAPRPVLVLTRGPSGAGKSVVSQALLERLGLVRLRSDVERKRLHGLPPDASTRNAPGEGIYGADASRLTFEHLAARARDLLESGLAVLVDATFLAAADRRPFLELADALGVPARIVEVRASRTTMAARVQRRADTGGDPSEAGLEVLQRQLEHWEASPPEEAPHVLVVDNDTDGAPDVEAAVSVLSSLRGGG